MTLRLLLIELDPNFTVALNFSPSKENFEKQFVTILLSHINFCLKLAAKLSTCYYILRPLILTFER